MSLDIQQYRILTLLSSDIFDHVWFDSEKAEKCDTSVRKPYFLRPWGAKIPVAVAVVCGRKLFFRPASGTTEHIGEEHSKGEGRSLGEGNPKGEGRSLGEGFSLGERFSLGKSDIREEE